MVVARELTKIHEEFLRGTVAEVRTSLASRDRVRGEITLLVEAPPWSPSTEAAQAAETLAGRVARLQAAHGLDEKEALKLLARELGRPKSDRLSRTAAREGEPAPVSFRH